jgi:hypothetical protein
MTIKARKNEKMKRKFQTDLRRVSVTNWKRGDVRKDRATLQRDAGVNDTRTVA